MRIAHLLRKYNPAEWGGTETVIHQLFDGLRHHGVESIVYCPRLSGTGVSPVSGNGSNGHHGQDARATLIRDPLADAGCLVNRFNACLPVWGISEEKRRQLIAVGGNLLSLDLLRQLWSAREFSVIHTHTLGRIAGVGLTIARQKKIPFVITIHGGLYDLPACMDRSFNRPKDAGWEWGKAFGLLLRSRHVLDHADAVLTCNAREADLVRERHPGRIVLVQPHGVRAELYETDYRLIAHQAFPAVRGRDVLLSLGRIDPVKNQGWLVAQMPAVLQRHPNALLVLAGACTDEAYGVALEKQIAELGLGGRVLLTGKLPPSDPRLIGLVQEARVAILQSISETFGLVILEAWAAGTPAISSRTSGASALIEHGKTGWLFDLERPAEFHAALDTTLTRPEHVKPIVAAARARVIADFDTRVLSGRLRNLYQELGERKRGPARDNRDSRLARGGLHEKERVG
jgi:alpha-maltose-1-phosphate synthase